MHIYGPSQVHGPQSINAPHVSRASQPAQRIDSAPIQDELQISDAARLIEQVKSAPDMRMDRVNEIRKQIASGTYETQDKIDTAVAGSDSSDHRARVSRSSGARPVDSSALGAADRTLDVAHKP